MDKINSFDQNKKKIVVGILALGLTGALSVLLYKYLKERKKKPNRSSKPTNANKKVDTVVKKEKILSEKELLDIITSIKKMCNSELKALRNKFRIERRKVFYDEEAYQSLLDEYNFKLMQILESSSEIVFRQHHTTHDLFDQAVKLYIDDEEIISAVDSMATVTEECKAPSHITRELLLEIFNFNNKKCNEAVFESNVNLEYLNTRIQDEIYFKYNIEMEELTACYKKFNCEKDPDFQPKIDGDAEVNVSICQCVLTQQNSTRPEDILSKCLCIIHPSFRCKQIIVSSLEQYMKLFPGFKTNLNQKREAFFLCVW